MSHHPERTARNVRPVNQPPSFQNHQHSLAGADDGELAGGLRVKAKSGGKIDRYIAPVDRLLALDEPYPASRLRRMVDILPVNRHVDCRRILELKFTIDIERQPLEPFRRHIEVDRAAALETRPAEAVYLRIRAGYGEDRTCSPVHSKPERAGRSGRDVAI